MGSGRLFLLVLALTALAGAGPADAGWWFGEDSLGDKTGLDTMHGYDVNTVTTVAGTAVSSPQQADRKNVVVEVKAGSENLVLCLGPAGYWENKGLSVGINDEIVVKGSMAQGKDGRKYLLVQKLTNKSTGAQVELRNEKGIPGWSGRGMGGRSEGGMRPRGGMMRGGGGGMMRR